MPWRRLCNGFFNPTTALFAGTAFSCSDGKLSKGARRKTGREVAIVTRVLAVAALPRPSTTRALIALAIRSHGPQNGDLRSPGLGVDVLLLRLLILLTPSCHAALHEVTVIDSGGSATTGYATARQVET